MRFARTLLALTTVAANVIVVVVVVVIVIVVANISHYVSVSGGSRTITPLHL